MWIDWLCCHCFLTATAVTVYWTTWYRRPLVREKGCGCLHVGSSVPPASLVWLCYVAVFVNDVEFHCRNAEGCTPFMQAVCQRAYPAALYLLDTAKRIATGRERIDVVDTELLMSMLFPPGSSLDNSPLHILCCNDLCSFTWTGDEHINQVTCSASNVPCNLY